MSLSHIGPALGGGALIGIAASMLLVLGRETAGISGILDGLIRPVTTGRSWRGSFLAGLVLGGLLLAALRPDVFGAAPRSSGLLVGAGLLVGFGTRMGGGCTSGHGVCGISRLSGPSIAATITFIAAGVLTVALCAALGVGS